MMKRWKCWFFIGLLAMVPVSIKAQDDLSNWSEIQTLHKQYLSPVVGGESVAIGFYFPDTIYAEDRSRLLSFLSYLKYNSLPNKGSSVPLQLQLPLVNRPIVLNKVFASWKAPLFFGRVDSSFIQKPYNFIERQSIWNDWRFEQEVFHRLQTESLPLFRYTASDLLAHRVDNRRIDGADAKVTSPDTKGTSTANVASFTFFKPNRRYWFPSVQGLVHITQNYISPNWHKGGISNLNLSSKQLFRLDYRTDKSTWTNELEWRLSLFSAIQDRQEEKKAAYRISEDLLRLRSNWGYKAFKGWYYTVDTELRTQAFANYSEDGQVLYSHFLSPLTFTAGLGMRYRQDHKSKTRYGRRFKIDVNISPLAYNLKWSRRMDIDLSRHGLQDNKRRYSAIGSMLRVDMLWNFNASLAWESRFYYNTSYKRVEAEADNSLIFSFNNYLSTRLNLVLRFDDSIPLVLGRDKTRLQVYQLLSFGFDYVF